MITIFNRKEVMNTFSMKQQSDVRSILGINKIDYKTKIVNIGGSNNYGAVRGQFGSLGVDEDYSREYYIYVHKKDYENAKFIISKERDSYH